jgi:hypothetical protein
MRTFGVCVFLTVFSSVAAQASVVSGHFTAGGYIATERFSNTDGGSDNNDAEMFSGRLYMHISDIGNKPWEVIADLRDKDDFFDKADRERLQLTGRNTFQAKELDAKYTGKAWAGTVGRFPLLEAGAVGVDGGLLQKIHSKSWRTGFFAGLNPKREDQTYYQLNPQDHIAGVHTTYQSVGSDWTRNLYLSHALNTEMHGSQTDRTYLFHNAIYQWNSQSRLISLMYLDFVPRMYIQNGNLTWQQYISKKWNSQLSLMAIDVITYSRRQNLRETLAPSPYREVSGRLDYQFNPTGKFEMGAAEGIRDADHLSKTELYLGLEQSQLFSRRWDVFGKLGGRKNFTSNDIFANVYAGYFSRRWETGIDVEYGIEKYKDGVTKHPITIELDLSSFMSRSMYWTVSLQRAQDEAVKINTAFFKLGYRFGSRENAPLRDGSPPRGQL